MRREPAVRSDATIPAKNQATLLARRAKSLTGRVSTPAIPADEPCRASWQTLTATALSRSFCRLHRKSHIQPPMRRHEIGDEQWGKIEDGLRENAASRDERRSERQRES